MFGYYSMPPKGVPMPIVVQKSPEKKPSLVRLGHLVEAAQQVHETLLVLSEDVRKAYSKQHAMLLSEIKKLKTDLDNESAARRMGS